MCSFSFTCTQTRKLYMYYITRRLAEVILPTTLVPRVNLSRRKAVTMQFTCAELNGLVSIT